MGWLDVIASFTGRGRTPRLDSNATRVLYSATTGLGAKDGPDRAGTISPKPVHILTDRELADLFRGSQFARRIVLEAPGESVRAGWRIEGEGFDPDQKAALESILNTLRHRHRFYEADWRSRHKGGAGVIVVTGEMDGEDLDQELAPSRLVSVRNLIVATKQELQPLTWQNDPSDVDGFGKPLTYRWQPSWRQTQTAGEVVHASRVIRFEGAPISEEDRADAMGWGDSVLQSAWEAIRDYGSAAGNVSHIVETFNMLAFRVKELAEKLAAGTVEDSSEARTYIRERLRAINNTVGNLRMIMMDAEDESIDVIARSVAGLEGLIVNVLIVNLASAAEMPVTKLFGVAPPGLSTDDASGSRNWEQIISARQETRYEPPIRRLVELVMASREGPTRGTVVDFDVVFEPLSLPTPKEVAETEQIQANTLGVLRDIQVASSGEIRRGMYAGTREFAGVSIDVDHEPDPEPPAVVRSVNREPPNGNGTLNEITP